MLQESAHAPCCGLFRNPSTRVISSLMNKKDVQLLINFLKKIYSDYTPITKKLYSDYTKNDTPIILRLQKIILRLRQWGRE